MRIFKLLCGAVITVFSLASFANSYQVNADEDSCWNPPKWCLESSSRWSKYDKGKLIVTYHNVCQHRMYLRMCNTRVDGSEDCGASGISAGKKKNWSTYKSDGKYTYKWVGSIKGSKDWVCAGKVSGWND